jgi:integrase
MFAKPLLTHGGRVTKFMGIWKFSRKVGVRLTAVGCRHSFCTDALAAGLPETHVAALLGHSSTAMITKHYGHLSSRTQLLKDAAAKVRPA